MSLPDPSGKLYPPARISDLKVTRVDQSNFTATLEWTAVGEQASIGQGKKSHITKSQLQNICIAASEYQLRYGKSSLNITKDFINMPLITNSMIINGANLKTPQPAGAREVFQIMLPRGMLLKINLDQFSNSVSFQMRNIMLSELLSLTTKRIEAPPAPSPTWPIYLSRQFQTQ